MRISATLIDWVQHFDARRLRQVFLVHGEPEAADTLAGKLRDLKMEEVTVPTLGQKFTF